MKWFYCFEEVLHCAYCLVFSVLLDGTAFICYAGQANFCKFV